MSNNDNMYQHMAILLIMHPVGLTLRTSVKFKYGLMDQFSFDLQKKTWLLEKQSIKLVNEHVLN